jgi:hypothetical protein
MADMRDMDCNDGGPRYELRAKAAGHGDMLLEIWQMPCPATPRLKTPERTAALRGRALRIAETRILRKLKSARIRLGNLKKGSVRKYPLNEDAALNLSLLFRVLAPMRNIDRMGLVAQGIDEMTREEAGYWLGMALHRKKPRRVLAALRMLLTSA